MSDRLLLFIGCVGLVTGVSSTAFAQYATQAPAAAPSGEAPVMAPAPAVEVVQDPAYFHEGFYLRAALGGGGMVDDFGGALGFVDASARGGSTGFELMIGYSIADGIAVGGGFLAEWMVEPAVENDGVPVDDDVGIGILTVIGPFIDWYPNPAGGFHVQGMLGGARITIEDQAGERSDHQPIGGAGAVGVGYEWWIGEEIGLGVLGRLTGGTLVDEGITHRVAAGTVMLTFTYN